MSVKDSIVETVEGLHEAGLMSAQEFGWYQSQLTNPQTQVVPEGYSHSWNDQDKCEKCGDRDWYAKPYCEVQD